jgi:glycosyltransferase involved in cell wall biosynthesis
MRLASFVIPTLREETLGEALTRLSEHLLTLDGYDFELLISDDSPDSFKPTLDEVIATHQAAFAPRVVARRVDGPHTGKGGAIRAGVLASRGEVVFTLDADLPVPLKHIGRFLELIEQGQDLVVAERPFDRNVRNPVRFIASRALFVVSRVFVFQSGAFSDTQCGFKAYRGDLARQLAAQQIVDGGMVDIEYLYAAVRAGSRVARVPVVPNPETRESKINVRRALWRDPLDLVRVKLHGITGGYRRGP